MDEQERPMRHFTITSMAGEKPGPDTHTIRSDYVEHEWLRFLKPTAMMFARRIDFILTTDGKNAVGIKQWADELGCEQEDILLAANRLIRFGLATWSERDKTFLISRHWPSVPVAIRTPQHMNVLIGLPDVEVSV